MRWLKGLVYSHRAVPVSDPYKPGKWNSSAAPERRAYQRISFSITHWDLFGGGALPGHRVAIKAHILRPQLEQRGPLVVLGAGCPGVGVHHPLGRVLPGGSPPVQLKENKTVPNIPITSPQCPPNQSERTTLLGLQETLCKQGFPYPNDTQTPLSWHSFGKSWPPSLRLQCPSLGTSWRKKMPENNLT